MPTLTEAMGSPWLTGWGMLRGGLLVRRTAVGRRRFVSCGLGTAFAVDQLVEPADLALGGLEAVSLQLEGVRVHPLGVRFSFFAKTDPSTRLRILEGRRVAGSALAKNENRTPKVS